jgi:uncharacterized membrane protein (UPF0127 family)
VQQVLVRNLSRDSLQPIQARYCASFLCRLRGLTFRRSLGNQDALLLAHAGDSRLDSSIHMLGVLIDLAVVWIDSQDEVIDVRLARRWRPVYLPKRPARYVLEMHAERLNDFRVGDRVRFEEVGTDR